MKKNIIIIMLLAGIVPLSAQKHETTKSKASHTKTKQDSTSEKRIDEVVITSSYGTKKLKEEVVGSISTISANDIITSQPYESLDKMIAGLSPGVQIGSNSALGGPVDINIRGLGSLVSLGTNIIGVSTQPLIIIDGVIMREDRAFSSTFFGNTENSEPLLNPLARLSTDNIESINILKDAAAVALYGADAANGVILITTKGGHKGKPRFSLSTQYGVSTSINKMKYMNGEQYASVYDAYLRNNGSTTGYQWNGVDVNWFDVMNGTGDYFKTNFSATGGKKWFSFRLGADYSANNESKIYNSFDKKGIDANLSFDFKKLRANLYFAYNQIDKDTPNSYFNFILAPTFSIYDANGNFTPTGYVGIANPMAAAVQNIANTNNKSLLSSLNLSYQATKNFKISTVLGVDKSDKETTIWRSGLNGSGQRNGTFLGPNNTRYQRAGYSRLNYTDAFKWNWSLQTYYEKKIAQHEIDILAGLELRENKEFREAHIGNFGYLDASYYQLPWEVYLPANYTYASLTQENAGRSLFTQLNYNFKKKYFFSGTIRRDESSAFGSDSQVAYNGGLGLSWLINKENFLRDSHWIDMLRLRTSWGITGNSRIGSYRALGLYSTPSENDFEYQYPTATADTSAPPNTSLKWEKNEKFNIGLDFNFGKRYELTLEVFRDNISDMIVNRATPIETGYSSAEINGAAMYNQGIEFSAKADWLRSKNLKWSTRFNIATVKNRVTELIGFGDAYSIQSLARAQKIGTPTSAIWGYEWLGINPSNGQDILMVNGVPTDANAFTVSTDTFTIIGDTQPDAIGGLTNSFRYKNFSFSFLVNFQIGGDILIADELIDQYRIMLNRNMSINALDFWSPTNPNAQNHLPSSRSTKIIPNMSKYVYDNTHIKLQNINLGYQIPLQKKDFIKGANIFMDITNVLYWYKQKSPKDRNGVRELRFLYPEMRTLSLGFRLNF
ncbi:MAG: SusC/RagA family TonB-linked outer membrane protein [Bergeyella zoohelcum]|nr:SusC/RagA family TonB-linked outer membrane protein [Bergeyella zoohelcum]